MKHATSLFKLSIISAVLLASFSASAERVYQFSNDPGDMKAAPTSKAPFSHAYYKPRFSTGPYYDTDVHSFGLFDLFVPYAFNPDSIIFVNGRFKWNHGPTEEGNYGMGMRHIFSQSQTYLGLYAFYDRRTSTFKNIFNQITVGGEFKSERWSLAANAYIPVGTTQHFVSALNSAQLVQADGGFQNIGFRRGAEKAMTGGDILGGWLIPHTHGLGIWLGGFYYDAKDVKHAAGPIVHTEWELERADGKRMFHIFNALHLVADYQHDQLRGSTWFAGARFDLLLGHQRQLHGIQRRMQDFVRRDLNIQTGANSEQALTLLTNANGTPVTVQQVSGAFAASTANIVGVQGAINNGAGTVTLASGQELNGGAYSFSVDGEAYSVVVGSNGSITSTANTVTTTNPSPGGVTIENIALTSTGASTVQLAAGNQGTVTIRNSNITTTAAANSLNLNPSAAGNATTTMNVEGNTLTSAAVPLFIGAADAASPVIASVVGNTVTSTGAGQSAVFISPLVANAQITVTEFANNTVNSLGTNPTVLFDTSASQVTVGSFTGNTVTNTNAGAAPAFRARARAGGAASTINFTNGISNNTFTSAGTESTVLLEADTNTGSTVTVGGFTNNTVNANNAGAGAFGMELNPIAAGTVVTVNGMTGNTFTSLGAAASTTLNATNATATATINVNNGAATLSASNTFANLPTLSGGGGTETVNPGI